MSYKFVEQLHVVIRRTCQCHKFLKCLIWGEFSEEDMYRAADEIEKEKELLIHERGSSGMFGIVFFIKSSYCL